MRDWKIAIATLQYWYVTFLSRSASDPAAFQRSCSPPSGQLKNRHNILFLLKQFTQCTTHTIEHASMCSRAASHRWAAVQISLNPLVLNKAFMKVLAQGAITSPDSWGPLLLQVKYINCGGFLFFVFFSRTGTALKQRQQHKTANRNVARVQFRSAWSTLRENTACSMRPTESGGLVRPMLQR